MRSGGGKAKGSEFERHVCKQLSLWITHGKKQDIFWRSAMSGGRATVALNFDIVLSAQAGDVSAVHEEGYKFTNKYYVEIKFYKDLEYKSLLLNNTGKFAKFWEHDTCEQARRYSKLPMFIAKENRQPIMIGLNTIGVQNFGDLRSIAKARLFATDLWLVPFEDFLHKASPKRL